MTIDPEKIAAYADGELGPEEAAQVEAAMASDPTILKQVEAHRALRDQLRAHFAPMLDAPVPGHLTALLGTLDEKDKVIDLAAVRRAREEAKPAIAPQRRWLTGGALAASLALGLVLGTQVPRGAGDAPIVRDGGQLIAGGALDTALANQLASDQQGKDVRILLSFEDRAGRYCRSFEDATTAGIACHNGTGWAIERLQSRRDEGTAQGQYRQAGSAGRDIMEASQNMALNGALDVEAERKARDSGWRR
jgi:hypothetical protein